MKTDDRKYWIVIAWKDHVRRGESGSFAQACHGKSTPLKKMNSGDYVIYYSSKEQFNKADKCQEFTAIGQVTDDNIYQFEMNEDFSPYRIKVEFYPSKDISILPLIDDLEFIPNKQKWGYPFRWGILQISENDYKLIANLMLDGQEN